MATRPAEPCRGPGIDERDVAPRHERERDAGHAIGQQDGRIGLHDDRASNKPVRMRAIAPKRPAAAHPVPAWHPHGLAHGAEGTGDDGRAVAEHLFRTSPRQQATKRRVAAGNHGTPAR